MIPFPQLYEKFLTSVWETDADIQRRYLKIVEEHRNIPVDYLESLGTVFIPNNDYITYFCGRVATCPEYDLYSQDGICYWTHFVIIPIRNLAGEICGIVGWDAENKYKEVYKGAEGLPMYRVSNTTVFPKDKFFLSDIKVLHRTFSNRIVCVTDGVFDTVALNWRDIPSIALLGSNFSKEVLFFLRWYKTVYVVTDNDHAGVTLYQKLSKSLPNVRRITQDKCKDIEEYLRDDGIAGVKTTTLKRLLPLGSDISLTESGIPHCRRIFLKGVNKIAGVKS